MKQYAGLINSSLLLSALLLQTHWKSLQLVMHVSGPKYIHKKEIDKAMSEGRNSVQQS